MKKIALFIAFLCLAHFSMKAADISPDRQWCVPAQYSMDEEITWYFDFSGSTALPDGGDLYIWIWVPVNPVPGLPDPNQDKVKLDYKGDRIWALTFTPTEFFGMSAADIHANPETSFYFLLRSLEFEDWHTGTLSFPKVDYAGDFVKSGKMWDYATDDVQKKLYPTSYLTLWFNANLADGFDGVSDVHIHSGYNNFSDHVIEYHAWETVEAGFPCDQPQTACYTEFKNLGNGIYKKDLVPYEYFQAEKTDPMQNIEFLFVQKDWSATTANQTILAADVPPPPIPVLSLFPTNVSKFDILTIRRTYNVRNSTPLKYEIEGAGKTINGEFTGSLDLQEFYLNIRKEFGDNVSSLHIVIRDHNDNVISDSVKQLTIAD
ncbi:MAG: hypothetical protein LBR97_05385 [Dysgonamonadaceae bacterium]|jgi:hypothetical protein|nr:hypothetical protein [Dysgonamonadaceae bacterium]